MLTFFIVIILFLIIAIIYSWVDYRRAPKLSNVYANGRELPLISVLVPARNEEANIANCLDSLIMQDYANYEIIVIDDNSTDRTYEVATEYASKFPNIKVLKCPEKPEGWLGKSYALHYGIQESKGDYFAFIDADVTLSNRILSRAFWFLNEHNASMISLLPTLVNKTFWECTVQPVMGYMIVLTYPHNLVNNPKSSRVVANGQFILFERNAYFKVGGHEAIKSEIVEDVELARLVKKNNFRYYIVIALDDMKTHMYHSLKDIWRGWGKSIYPYIKSSPIKLWLGLILLFIIFFLPFITIILTSYKLCTSTPSSFSFWSNIFYLNLLSIIIIIINSAFARRSMNQNPIYALFFPLGFAILFALFIKRTYDYVKKTGVVWKDRIYR